MKIIGFAALIMLGSTAIAQATIISITDPSQLGTYGTVNWGIFGPVPSTVSTYAAEPVGSETVHINTASGELDIEPGSAVGGFLSTDTLLTQLPGNLSDLILVGFSTPVQGIGTQIESLLSGPFTGYLDLYDISGNLLGEVSVDASTTSAADGSAPFIGAISSSADIDYAIFSVNNGNPTFPKAGDVAINSLEFSTPVPEPLTVSVFGAGIAGAAMIRRRKKRARV